MHTQKEEEEEEEGELGGRHLGEGINPFDDCRQEKTAQQPTRLAGKEHNNLYTI